MADFEIGQRLHIKWCFQLIERLADLERQLAEAYDALGNVNRGVYLHDYIFALKQQLAEMTADRNLWKDDHDGDCPYKTQLADSRSQLAMKKWPTKYDELMCDPVFRAAYAKEWARTDGDNLRMQLDDNPPQSEKPSTTA